MTKRKDMVNVTCYGRKETLTRHQALQKYRDCAVHSEGHERNRYFNVLMDLMDGKTECSDHDGDY